MFVIDLIRPRKLREGPAEDSGFSEYLIGRENLLVGLGNTLCDDKMVRRDYGRPEAFARRSRGPRNPKSLLALLGNLNTSPRRFPTTKPDVTTRRSSCSAFPPRCARARARPRTTVVGRTPSFQRYLLVSVTQDGFEVPKSFPNETAPQGFMRNDIAAPSSGDCTSATLFYTARRRAYGV
jgi:hypothetical protein